MPYEIAAFDNEKHREQVVALWQDVFGYPDARNAPGLVIDKKRAVDDGLFFVLLQGPQVVGTVMAGYDGHRGWIYSLALLPQHRRAGLGSRLLAHAEARLLERGCVKVNLQILESNQAVRGFYLANGYRVEPRVSMGKQLPDAFNKTD